MKSPSSSDLRFVQSARQLRTIPSVKTLAKRTSRIALTMGKHRKVLDEDKEEHDEVAKHYASCTPPKPPRRAQIEHVEKTATEGPSGHARRRTRIVAPTISCTCGQGTCYKAPIFLDQDQPGQCCLEPTKIMSIKSEASCQHPNIYFQNNASA